MKKSTKKQSKLRKKLFKLKHPILNLKIRMTVDLQAISIKTAMKKTSSPTKMTSKKLTQNLMENQTAKQNSEAKKNKEAKMNTEMNSKTKWPKKMKPKERKERKKRKTSTMKVVASQMPKTSLTS